MNQHIATFTVPHAAQTATPVLEVTSSYPARSLLVTAEVTRPAGQDPQQLFCDYSWSEQLEAFYRYLPAQPEAPTTVSAPQIHLPTDFAGATLAISVRPWGDSGLNPGEAIGRVILSCSTAYGPMVLYPAPKQSDPMHR